MTDSSVPEFLALPEVQQDVVEGHSSSWRLMLLRLLAWKVLIPHSPDKRQQLVREWLPYMHHRSNTGMMQLVAAMNTTAQPSLLPPFPSGPPLCALWHATASWDGSSAQELLQLGQDAADHAD